MARAGGYMYDGTLLDDDFVAVPAAAVTSRVVFGAEEKLRLAIQGNEDLVHGIMSMGRERAVGRKGCDRHLEYVRNNTSTKHNLLGDTARRTVGVRVVDGHRREIVF
jgi:hypothetical protein